ncbi:MAG: DUF1700 domain-containing protein [Bdellovibrionales bacterium]|nr:DUF1700 domain-containing protein [Bdellovibrionales bacterium]
MTLDTQLENYLNRLDKALSAIAVSERAEIITEIKSHVLEAQQRSPERSLSSILESFGEPETVANRYIMERGLKPTPPPRSPVVKWLMIGLLGTFGMFCLTVLVIIFKFSPIVEVNEKEGKVRLFGGLIKVDEDVGRSVNVEVETGRESFRSVTGDQKVDVKKDKLAIRFDNAKMEIETGRDDVLRWSCRATGETPPLRVTKSEITLDLEKASKCNITVPEGLSTKINGNNGKISVIKPRNNLDLDVVNGKVGLLPDETQSYEFDVSVRNGKADKFPQAAQGARGGKPWKISLRLANGIVSSEI